MKPEAAFNAALARFQSADTDVAKLTLKLDDARVRRAEAASEVSTAQDEAKKFTAGSDFDPAAAATIAGRQSMSKAALELVDRAIENLKSELAGAKADVIAAERDCVSAQAAYHDSLLDESTHKWLRSNAKQLQALTQQLHLAAIFQHVYRDGPQAAYAATHVENLFLNVLPRLVSNEFADDERFRAGCQATLGGAPINRIVTSTHVTDHERHAIAGTHARDKQIAALRERSDYDAPVEVPFNRYTAELRLKQLQQRVDVMRTNVENIEQRIKDTQSARQPKSLGLQLSIEQDRKKLKSAQMELADIERQANDLEQRLQGKAA